MQRRHVGHPRGGNAYVLAVGVDEARASGVGGRDLEDLGFGGVGWELKDPHAKAACGAPGGIRNLRKNGEWNGGKCRRMRDLAFRCILGAVGRKPCGDATKSGKL